MRPTRHACGVLLKLYGEIGFDNGSYRLWTGDFGRCTHQCHHRHSDRLGSFCQSIATGCAILVFLFYRDLKHRLAELGKFQLQKKIGTICGHGGLTDCRDGKPPASPTILDKPSPVPIPRELIFAWLKQLGVRELNLRNANTSQRLSRGLGELRANGKIVRLVRRAKRYVPTHAVVHALIAMNVRTARLRRDHARRS